ncbi:hypothetical protein D9M68_239730 [compost metagenome]
MVATGDAFAAQVQLTGHAHRQRLQVGVEHVGAAPAHGTADGQEGGVEAGVRVGAPDQRGDHGFGRAVAVDDARRAQHPLDLVEGVLGHALATHGVGTDRQFAAGFADVVGHLQQVAGGEAGDGDAVAGDLGAGALHAPQLVVARHQRRAVDQRGQPALVGAVEADGGELQLAVFRGHAVQRADGQAVHGQRPLGDADAFRPAGGTGGVDEVRQVLRVAEVHRVVRRQVFQRLAVQGQQRQALGQRQAGLQPGLAEQQGDATVFHQVAQALGRIGRVQRHVGAARFQDGQQADDHFRRTLHRQADPHFRADAQLAQAMGQAVGAAIQLGVAPFQVTEDQRRGLGTQRRLGFDQLVHAAAVLRLRLRRVPLHQLLAAFVGGEQVEIAEGGLGRGDHGLQQRGQVPAHAGDGRAAEVAAQVAPGQAQAALVHRRQGQRVVGAFMVLRDGEGQSHRRALLQGSGDGEVLEHQQAVEQRLAGAAGPALDIRQGAELVFAQLQVLRLQLFQPLGDAQRRFGCGDHRQGIDEQAELAFRAGQVRRAAGHGGAEGHAALAAVALQQQHPGALHQGVEGHFLLAGEVGQTLAGGGIEQLPMVGITSLLRLAWRRVGQALGQQRGLVEVGQLRTPEGLVGLGVLCLQPTDVVGEATGRGGHLVAGIALQHLAQQQGVAPAVQQQVVMGVDQLLA